MTDDRASMSHDREIEITVHDKDGVKHVAYCAADYLGNQLHDQDVQYQAVRRGMVADWDAQDRADDLTIAIHEAYRALMRGKANEALAYLSAAIG